MAAPEQAVLNNLGIALADLQAYLRTNNLALLVSRNVTARDRNDRQQPFNLRVAGGGVESITTSGKVYEVSDLQFFLGELLRGYGSQNNQSARRRVLAQPLALSRKQPLERGRFSWQRAHCPGWLHGSYCSAQRALTWQLISPNGTPVSARALLVNLPTRRSARVRILSWCGSPLTN